MKAFGTTIKERPYDVNIKFTLLDPTEKKLHLFVVNYDQDNICQLKGLSENVTLSVLYQNGLNDINFYLDSDTIRRQQRPHIRVNRAPPNLQRRIQKI